MCYARLSVSAPIDQKTPEERNYRNACQSRGIERGDEAVENVVKCSGINKIMRHKYMAALSACVLLLVFSPYLRSGLIVGSDAPYHLARIETIAQDILHGNFPVKIHSDLCYGYGYGTGFFYPDFFLYIPAFFRIVGISLDTSFKIFAAMMLIGIFTSMFYSAFRLTGDKYAAFAAAVTFILTRQVLGSFYINFTLGTTLGMIFMPLAVCGMYELAEREKKPGLLIFGFTGLIFSHVLSTILTFVICAVILLMNGAHWLKEPGKWKKLAVRLLFSVGLVMCLTSCFWAPMLEQFKAQTYKMAAPWTYVDENIMSVRQLLQTDGIGWTLSVAAVCILPFVIIQLFAKGGERASALRQFYFLGIIFWILPVCSAVWEAGREIFKFLQFPSRLWASASVLMTFSLCILISEIQDKGTLKKLVIAGVFLLSLGSGIAYLSMREIKTESFAGRVLYKEIAGLGAGEEWLPLETDREDLIAPDTAFASDGEAVRGNKGAGEFLFEASSLKEYYDLPFVWYKGYRAVTTQGTRLEIGKAENGLVRVFAGARIQREQTVRVWYKGTALQRISLGLSIASFMAVGISLASRKIIMQRAKRRG